MGVGKCVSKENPKSDLDLDLGFVKNPKSDLDLDLGFVKIWKTFGKHWKIGKFC